jgi:hypothetical protein
MTIIAMLLGARRGIGLPPDQSARCVGAPGLPIPANRRRFTSKRDAIWRMSV